MPSLADHFGVGRAEAILTCSIMTLLTLGRYLHKFLLIFINFSLYIIYDQATLQWTPGGCFRLTAWSPCHHHAWRLLRICRYLSSTSCARQGLYFLHFSGLLIAGLYIESGPTVQNIVVVHVSVGGLVGLGFGLMYLPAMDIVPHYFDRRCSRNDFQEYIKDCYIRKAAPRPMYQHPNYFVADLAWRQV